MVTRIQVPDIAGTIQRAGEGFRDQRNINRARADQSEARKVDAAKLEGEQAHARYAELSKELTEGYKKLEAMRAAAPNPEAAAAQTRQLSTYLSTIAAKTDVMGGRLGYEPERLSSLFDISSQSPDGSMLSSGQGSIAADQANANALRGQELGTGQVVGANEAQRTAANVGGLAARGVPVQQGVNAADQANANALRGQELGTGQVVGANEALQTAANASTLGASNAPEQIGANAARQANSKNENLIRSGAERKIIKDADGLQRDADTGEYIFGDVAERFEAERLLEAKDTQAKDDLRISSMATNALNVVSAAKEAMSTVGTFTTGRTGQVIALVYPGSDAGQLRQAVTTVKANLAFDKLALMREASTNGSSGLGQLNKFEYAALEAALANLNTEADPERLRQELQVVLTHYNTLLGRFGEGYDESKDPRAHMFGAEASEEAPDLSSVSDEDLFR